ncbi:MAG: hypothetical protein L6R36_000313 [Xanthoria steineri]|nr:MAG: hypothetical protein L6R36_000313 [Xanthoria steineri]
MNHVASMSLIQTFYSSSTVIFQLWNLGSEGKVGGGYEELVGLSYASSSECRILSTRQDEPFPFMKLPLELRQMVYKELLVMPWPVIMDAPHCCYYPGKHLTHVVHDDGHPHEYCPLATCQIRQVSKALHIETTPIYFGHNTFKFRNLNALSFFLTKLKSESRRSITSLIVRYEGGHPARSMKLLRSCFALRRLSINCTWGTIRYGQFPWYTIRGLKYLLQIRGIQTLELKKPTPSEHFSWEAYRMEWQELLEALQVLKQPYTEAAIRRQDKKECPPEKAKRTLFGRANVVTRAEAASVSQSQTQGVRC